MEAKNWLVASLRIQLKKNITYSFSTNFSNLINKITLMIQ